MLSCSLFGLYGLAMVLSCANLARLTRSSSRFWKGNTTQAHLQMACWLAQSRDTLTPWAWRMILAKCKHARIAAHACRISALLSLRQGACAKLRAFIWVKTSALSPPQLCSFKFSPRPSTLNCLSLRLFIAPQSSTWPVGAAPGALRAHVPRSECCANPLVAFDCTIHAWSGCLEALKQDQPFLPQAWLLRTAFSLSPCTILFLKLTKRIKL